MSRQQCVVGLQVESHGAWAINSVILDIIAAGSVTLHAGGVVLPASVTSPELDELVLCTMPASVLPLLLGAGSVVFGCFSVVSTGAVAGSVSASAQATMSSDAVNAGASQRRADFMRGHRSLKRRPINLLRVSRKTKKDVDASPRRPLGIGGPNYLKLFDLPSRRDHRKVGRSEGANISKTISSALPHFPFNLSSRRS